MSVKNFQIYGVQINGKCMCKSKLKVDIFTPPRQNSLPGPYHHPPPPPHCSRKREITHSSQ